jgi:hypothetical protein
MRGTTIITVDHEHNCETWWDAARQNLGPLLIAETLHKLEANGTVKLWDDEASHFIAWASGLPGWDEKPFVISHETAAQ